MMNTARLGRCLALFLLPAAILGCGPDRPAPPPAATVDAAGTPFTADRFGVMGVPADPRSPAALRELGVGWVRITTFLGERERDRQVLPAVAREGFRIWLTLTHRDPGNCVEEGTVGFARAPRGGFAPRDPTRFQDLVRATVGPLVAEFRRQGKNPGEWLVIQVENEVLPVDVHPPDRPVRFWHGTADGYLRTLALARTAVKSLDPAIPVSLFGFSTEMLEACVAGRPPAAAAWAERALRAGGFDWTDVHLYQTIPSIPAKVAWVRARWSGPIAATEIGGPDPDVGGDPADEAALAGDLPRRMRAALDAGAAPACWVLLVETPGADERFRKMCLIDAAWRRRPAFAAYRELIAGSAGTR